VIGFGEVALAVEFCGDPLVAGELLAIIKREGLDDFVFEHTQDIARHFAGRFRPGIQYPALYHNSSDPEKLLS